MENKKAILISLVCFAISMVLISGYLSVKEKELTATFGPLVEVVVADENIPEYAIIQAKNLRTEKVYKAFKQPLTSELKSEIIGKATYVPIAAGEQVTLTKLIHQDGRPVLERQLEKKMRAVTTMVSPASGVGKLIRPGNRVDVLIGVNYDRNAKGIFEVKTLFQNVAVLATGKHIQNEVPTRVDRDLLNYIEEANTKLKRKDLFGSGTEGLASTRPDDNYNHVTLQLSTTDAEKLLFLTGKYGDKAIYLTLRNTTDPGVDKLSTALLDDVLGPESDYARSKRKPPVYTPPPPKSKDYMGSQEVPRY